MAFHDIYAHKTIGITELKRTTELLDNVIEPIAVLKRDMVKCYLVPEKFMQTVIELIDEIQLTKLVNKRIKEEIHLAKEVSLDDL
jgi:hypothetical protein